MVVPPLPALASSISWRGVTTYVWLAVGACALELRQETACYDGCALRGTTTTRSYTMRCDYCEKEIPDGDYFASVWGSVFCSQDCLSDWFDYQDGAADGD